MADWNISTAPEPRRITIRIVGQIEVEDATRAAKYTDALLSQAKGPTELCFDLCDLEGYPIAARNMWADLLRRQARSIHRLIWISPSATVRMVARAVGLFAGIPTQTLEAVPSHRRAA